MLVDELLKMADAESTGNTGTRVVGDVIDLGVARDIGAGEPVYVNALVETGITAGGTTGTYELAIETSTQAGLTTSTTLVSSASFDSSAGIDAGTVLLNAVLPAEAASNYGRYLGVKETVGNENTTAGKIDVFLSRDQRAYKNYPKGKSEAI